MAPAALISGRISSSATQTIRPTSSASNVTTSQSNPSSHTHRERRISSRATSLNDVKPTSDEERTTSCSSPSRSFRPIIDQPLPATHPVGLSAEAKPFSLPPSVSPSVVSLSLNIPKDHNSVSIKSNTSVKDAAGAIFKVLERIPSALITALHLEPGYESVNRAVKSIAVARKYLQDHQANSKEQYELSFLPVHRSNCHGIVDPSLFAFLAFKVKVSPSLQALPNEERCDPQDSLDDISVGRKSDIFSTANAIIRAVSSKGHAVMKAGGSEAVFVAMSALTSARQELKTRAADLMAVASWRTQDTCGFLGRDTKYLHFSILPCPVNGPISGAI